MISPVTLSIIFLVLTFFIVLGWTRLIFGSTKEEEEELLKNLKKQMTTLASIKEKTLEEEPLDQNPDTLIKTLYNSLDEPKTELPRQEHKKVKTSKTEDTLASSSYATANTDIEDKLNKYIEEMHAAIDKKCKPKMEMDKKSCIPIKKPENPNATPEMKKSHSFVSFLKPKPKRKKISFSLLGSKECGVDRLFFSSGSTSEDLFGKKQHVSRKTSHISTKFKRKNHSTESFSTSENSHSHSDEFAKKLCRHKSETDRFRKPTIFLRKTTSSNEMLLKKCSKDDSIFEDLKKSAEIRKYEDTAACSCSVIHQDNQKIDRVKRRKGSPYRNKSLNISPNLGLLEKREDVSKKEEDNAAEDFLKWREIFHSKIPSTKQEYTVQLLSELSSNQSSSLYQEDLKKLKTETKICENIIPDKPKKRFQEKSKQKHRPPSPQRYSKLHSTTKSSVISQRTCESDSTNRRPTSGSSSIRSKSCDQINNCNLVDKGYDFSLIFMETNNLNDLPHKKLDPGLILKPTTVDKSVEASKVNLTTQSVNTSLEYCADGTQTSFPKLVVQHLESYSAPVKEDSYSSPNLELKDENFSKIPRLTMPDIKLEKVSNSLRRSRNIIENKRNIIEELVKETRNLLSEQTEKSKDINNTKRPRSKIPRSPTSSLNNSSRCTPRHSPLHSTNISLLSTPTTSNHELTTTSNIKEKLDKLANIQNENETSNASHGIIEDGTSHDERPKTPADRSFKSKQADISHISTSPLKLTSNTQNAEILQVKQFYESQLNSGKYKPKSPPKTKCRKPQNETKPNNPNIQNACESVWTETISPSTVDRAIYTKEFIEEFTEIRPMTPKSPFYAKRTATTSTENSLNQKPKSILKTDLRPSSPGRQKEVEFKREIRNYYPQSKEETRKKRSPIPVYARPPSPRIRKEKSRPSSPSKFLNQMSQFLGKGSRPSSPINFHQMSTFPINGTRTSSPVNFNQRSQSPEQMESQIKEAQVKPSRHDMACSTSYLNSNLVTQSAADRGRTRWMLNDLQKYQSYNYSTFHDYYYYQPPAPNMANVPNFYCANDFCRPTPFMQRSLSPGAASKNETLRKMMHAKDIATRINR